MRHDDGIATVRPGKMWAERTRDMVRQRTKQQSREGRLRGVYCHDLPHLGAVMPEVMAEALCCHVDRVHTAARVGGARVSGFRVTKAGAPWSRPDPQAHKMKAVVRVEDGEPFPSMSHAAAAMGLARTTINYAVTAGGTAGGFHWRYAEAA